ncbi:cell wall protein IFF6 isoform X2 [Eurytemora carolleeae]|uniref:cell wall protein IFF6 isoform X2 n=1 Tax=Eurytemora carolleeae TaxID=1294199 RepID=UPI000C761754|nr:cell wall protein IFF6 isoform X2 [Eurytemora carolleeae]|eukprot:XP_023326242.1 cell wall protein IFF6-like isoform X2 [Eurytemora affinis]
MIFIYSSVLNILAQVTTGSQIIETRKGNFFLQLEPQNGRGYGKGLDVRRPPKPTGGDDYAETPPPRGYSLQPPIPRGYASEIESSIDPTIQTPDPLGVIEPGVLGPGVPGPGVPAPGGFNSKQKIEQEAMKIMSETKAEFHDEKEDTKCQYKNWGPFAACSKLETGKCRQARVREPMFPEQCDRLSIEAKECNCESVIDNPENPTGTNWENREPSKESSKDVKETTETLMEMSSTKLSNIGSTIPLQKINSTESTTLAADINPAEYTTAAAAEINPAESTTGATAVINSAESTTGAVTDINPAESTTSAADINLAESSTASADINPAESTNSAADINPAESTSSAADINPAESTTAAVSEINSTESTTAAATEINPAESSTTAFTSADKISSNETSTTNYGETNADKITTAYGHTNTDETATTAYGVTSKDETSTTAYVETNSAETSNTPYGEQSINETSTTAYVETDTDEKDDTANEEQNTNITATTAYGEHNTTTVASEINTDKSTAEIGEISTDETATTTADNYTILPIIQNETDDAAPGDLASTIASDLETTESEQPTTMASENGANETASSLGQEVETNTTNTGDKALNMTISPELGANHTDQTQSSTSTSEAGTNEGDESTTIASTETGPNRKDSDELEDTSTLATATTLGSENWTSGKNASEELKKGYTEEKVDEEGSTGGYDEGSGDKAEGSGEERR